MKTIKIKVVENGHRYNTLMNLLRQDNYDFTIEAETEQAKISSNPVLADSKPRHCPKCNSTNVIMFDSNNDLCNDCGAYFC